MRPFRSALAALTSSAALAVPAAAMTLYDPAQATLPEAQGWSVLSSGSGSSRSFVDGRLRTDTLTDPSATQFVVFRTSPFALDTVSGFTLNFGLQVQAEAHQSDNRAGYSVLLQGLDQRKSLELSFWESEVWAMDFVPGGADGGFVRGNGAALDTTSAFRQYALTVQGNLYTLRADGSAVLSGTMVDYAPGFPASVIYNASNVLFFGDNSSRGQSVVDLGLVSVTAVPEPASALLLAAGLALALLRARRRA
jgi:hypothetical protein